MNAAFVSKLLTETVEGRLLVVQQMGLNAKKHKHAERM